MNDPFAFQKLTDRARFLAAQGRYQEVINIVEPAALSDSGLARTNEIIDLRILLATAYYEKGNFVQAKSLLESTLSMPEIDTEFAESVTCCLHELSLVYWRLGLLDMATEACGKALRRRLDDCSDATSLLCTFAILHLETGKLEQARDYLEFFREECEARRDSSGVAKAYHELAMVWERLGDLNRTVRCTMASLRIKMQLADVIGETKTRHNFKVLLKRHPEVVRDSQILEMLRDRDTFGDLNSLNLFSAAGSKTQTFAPAPLQRYPHADPDRAAQLNQKYQEQLSAWSALPWWRRMKTKRPERPVGI
jgi:tetratricopeptide (TPR) repeat protein